MLPLGYVFDSSKGEIGRGRESAAMEFGQAQAEQAVRSSQMINSASRGAWETKFLELKAIRDAGGDPNIKQETPLGRWLNNQRSARKAGRLSDERISALESVGVSWHVQDMRWSGVLEKLSDISKAGGDPNVHFSHEYGPWLARQRTLHRMGSLIDERRAALEEIGIKLILNPGWQERADELAAFMRLRPDLPLTRTLRNWLGNQRRAYRLGNMPDDRVAALQAMGISMEMSARRRRVPRSRSR